MGCCAIRPRDQGECRDTLELRNQFEAKKRKLQAALGAGRFSPAQLDEVKEFTSGRKDPAVDRFGESITQHKLRDGIDAMEDLLDLAGAVEHQPVSA